MPKSIRILHPCRRFDCAARRIDPRDARDQKIRLAQIEAVGERQRHGRCRSVRVGHARRHHANVVAVAMHFRIVRREAGHLDRFPRAEIVESDLAFGTEHRDGHDLDLPAAAVVVVLCEGTAGEDRERSESCGKKAGAGSLADCRVLFHGRRVPREGSNFEGKPRPVCLSRCLAVVPKGGRGQPGDYRSINKIEKEPVTFKSFA